jgi:hypothetical protein
MHSGTGLGRREKCCRAAQQSASCATADVLLESLRHPDSARADIPRPESDSINGKSLLLDSMC